MERTVFIKSDYSRVREKKIPDRKQMDQLWSGKKKLEKEDVKYETETETEIVPSDRVVDGDYLAAEVQKVTNDLVLDGYKIISIIPVTSGSYSVASNFFGPDSSYYGYSYTSGVLIHASKG
jgi:hypothetical protein